MEEERMACGRIAIRREKVWLEQTYDFFSAAIPEKDVLEKQQQEGINSAAYFPQEIKPNSFWHLL